MLMTTSLMPSPGEKAVRSFRVDSLSVRVCADRPALARDAAEMAHEYLTSVLTRQGQAAVILATGNSQIQFLENLVGLGGIDWSKVTLFHMDEYLGIDANHTASFRRYMKERVESRVTPKVFHYLKGMRWSRSRNANVIADCSRRNPLTSAVWGWEKMDTLLSMILPSRI